jgi:hypothetical protein
MGCGLDRFIDRPIHVRCAHDQAGRTVTNQSSAEPAESQTWSRSYSMDDDCFRLRNGFPRWVSPAGDDAIAAWLMIRKHPKMFQLWGLSLSQKSYYDPRKY